jgi:hypothetical protein
MKFLKLIFLALFVVLVSSFVLNAQDSPNRVGTTAANFLELGFDPKGIAMGDATVSSVDNLSAIYWNPSGLAFMKQDEVLFSYQPWLANTRNFLASVGVISPNLGTFALSVLGMDYGEMEVTTMELQEGTGEKFTPQDLAVILSYGRSITSWFGFGASIKYIYSSIYHETADAFAFDFGVTIKTAFLSPTNNDDGLRLGMSISNYGTEMQYRGLDLMRSIDIAPDESGNYKDTKVDFQTESWELPLLFRVGVSATPILMTNHRLTIALNAIHANNNNESVNVGAEYAFNMPGLAKLFFRGGYRGFFLEDSEFGPTFGVGIQVPFLRQNAVQIDYAYRDNGILGFSHAVGISLLF